MNLRRHAARSTACLTIRRTTLLQALVRGVTYMTVLHLQQDTKPRLTRLS